MGFPPLRVHVPVGSHADMVSGWRGPRGAEQGAMASPRAHTSPGLCPRPDGLMYQKFRNQFLSFSMYQSECLRGPSELGFGGRGGDWGSSPC